MNPVTFACESLETRQLLSADISAKGTLQIIGTRKADTIYVTYGPNDLDLLFVQINRDVFSFNFDEVKRITVQSGALPDKIEFRALALNPDRFKIPATLYGSTGDDLIIAPASTTRIYGGTGNDKIFGNFSRDIIYGEEGHDTIDGGQGADYLSGDADDDVITGGLGFDQMFGGPGNDTFHTRGDLPSSFNPQFFPDLRSFDVLDGGEGSDRADADSVDRLISIESTFRAP